MDGLVLGLAAGAIVGLVGVLLLRTMAPRQWGSLAGAIVAVVFLVQGLTEVLGGAGAFPLMQIAMSAAAAGYFGASLLRAHL